MTRPWPDADDPSPREDPAGVYGRMDFATRDGYRHVIEHVAKRSAASEAEVARIALTLTRQALDSATPVDPPAFDSTKPPFRRRSSAC